MDRRDVLGVLESASLAVLVGCSGSSRDGNGDRNANETDDGDQPSGTDETDDGSQQVNDSRETNGSETETPRQGTVEVDVGPGTVYSPASLLIEQGTTVRWVWRGDNHNVSVTEQPPDADWDGHTPIEDTGFEYEFEFTVPGTYGYICEPHVRQGMTGDVTVQ